MTVEAETTCLKDFFFAFVLNNLLGFWVFCFVCLFLSPWDRKKEQGVADSFELLFGTTPLEQVVREGIWVG